MADQTKKVNPIKKFFKDYKSEFKKIVWPDKKDTMRQSGVVVVAIIIVGLALMVLDIGFGKLFELLADMIHL